MSVLNLMFLLCLMIVLRSVCLIDLFMFERLVGLFMEWWLCLYLLRLICVFWLKLVWVKVLLRVLILSFYFCGDCICIVRLDVVVNFLVSVY